MTLFRLWNMKLFPCQDSCMRYMWWEHAGRQVRNDEKLTGRTDRGPTRGVLHLYHLSLTPVHSAVTKTERGGSKTQLSPSPIQKITGRGSLEMSRWLSNFISSSVLSIMRCLLSELWILDGTSLEIRRNHLKAGRVKSIVLLVIWRNGWLKKRFFKVLSKGRRVALHFLQQWQ